MGLLRSDCMETRSSILLAEGGSDSTVNADKDTGRLTLDSSGSDPGVLISEVVQAQKPKLNSAVGVVLNSWISREDGVMLHVVLRDGREVRVGDHFCSGGWVGSVKSLFSFETGTVSVSVPASLGILGDLHQIGLQEYDSAAAVSVKGFSNSATCRIGLYESGTESGHKTKCRQVSGINSTSDENDDTTSYLANSGNGDNTFSDHALNDSNSGHRASSISSCTSATIVVDSAESTPYPYRAHRPLVRKPITAAHGGMGVHMSVRLLTDDGDRAAGAPSSSNAADNMEPRPLGDRIIFADEVLCRSIAAQRRMGFVVGNHIVPSESVKRYRLNELRGRLSPKVVDKTHNMREFDDGIGKAFSVRKMKEIGSKRKLTRDAVDDEGDIRVASVDDSSEQDHKGSHTSEIEADDPRIGKVILKASSELILGTIVDSLDDL